LYIGSLTTAWSYNFVEINHACRSDVSALVI